jgi:hypothetical protein
MDELQRDLLRKPFPPELVGQIPKAGIMLDYVGHAAVTDRLLQVDPEWTWQPMAVDAHGAPALDADYNLWILLTVGGVTRPGVGDGRNMKERIGDAIRNAAMRFGVALDLWAKEPLHVQEGDTGEPLPMTSSQTTELSSVLAKLTDDQAFEVKQWWKDCNLPPKNRLNEEQASNVIEHLYKVIKDGEE